MARIVRSYRELSIAIAAGFRLERHLSEEGRCTYLLRTDGTMILPPRGSRLNSWFVLGALERGFIREHERAIPGKVVGTFALGERGVHDIAGVDVYDYAIKRWGRR